MGKDEKRLSDNVEKKAKCLDNEEEYHAAGIPIQEFSRQMREPLTDIFAALPLMAAHLDETGQRYVESILTNGYKLLRLSNNLENFARLSLKRKVNCSIDLASLVESLCICAELVCRSSGIPITWKIPATPLPAKIPAELFSDVFLYIVRNSLQYTKDGNKISVKLKRLGNKAVLTVADLGMGIKPDVMEKMFEPYFSLNPYADTDEKPGIGISLYIARQALQAFGATVSVESKFGEGTSIHVAIPLSEENEDVLLSVPADYLMNRFSAVYVQLCGLCRLPEP